MVLTSLWEVSVMGSDVAFVLQGSVEPDCAGAGKRTVASAEPPRATAQEPEQTYYHFFGQIK